MSFWSGPPETPPLETHFFEVLREVGGWGGRQKCGKNDPPFFVFQIMNLLVFSTLSQKSVSGSRLHGVCTGWSGAHAVYALSSHFCYVGGFGDLGEPVVPTLRGVSGGCCDSICLLGYERSFFAVSSLAGSRSQPVPKTRNDVSTNNGLVNGPVHNLRIQFFTLGSSKIEVFETCFYDIVTTQYDHPRYVKHVLGRIYMIFTLFGYSLRRGGRGGGSQGMGTQSADAVFRPG